MLSIFISFSFWSLKSKRNVSVAIIIKAPEPISAPEIIIFSRRFASGTKIIVINPARMNKIAFRRRKVVLFVS